MALICARLRSSVGTARRGCIRRPEGPSPSSLQRPRGGYRFRQRAVAWPGVAASRAGETRKPEPAPDELQHAHPCKRVDSETTGLGPHLALHHPGAVGPVTIAFIGFARPLKAAANEGTEGLP